MKKKNITAVLLLLAGMLVLGRGFPARAEIATVHTGVVVAMIHTGGYTYIEYKHENNKMWVAVPKMDIKEGDKISFEGGYLMTDFHSKSLNRTFSAIFFVGEVQIIKPE